MYLFNIYVMGYCLFVCFCERIYDQNVDCVDDESILRRIFKLFLFIRIFSCSIRMKYTHLDNAKRSDVGTTITGGNGQSLSIQDILLAARKSNLIAILPRNSPRFEVGYFFRKLYISMLDLLAVGPKFTRPACRAAAAAIDRYLLPAPVLSSKPADRRCCCRSTGQTDGRTDGRTDTGPFYDAYRMLRGPRRMHD